MPEELPNAIRIERTFYPDGTPKEETHYRGESCHGPWRQWHPNGALAREWWYDKHVIADGTHREWFPNGQIQREMVFRDGKIIQQIEYSAKGERVPTMWERMLAEERAFMAKSAAKAKLVPAPKRLAAADAEEANRSETFVRSLLATRTEPARTWLGESGQESPRSLGEMDHALSNFLVETLHDLGAPEVLAVEISSDPSDGSETTNHLVVVLPEDPAARARVLKFANALSHRQGFDKEADRGQRHLYMKLC